MKAKRQEGDAWRFQIGKDKGGVNGGIRLDAILGKAISAGGRPL